jgi:hypothetical protein
MRTDRPLEMPSFGKIKGGRLDGWRFHFLHFKATPTELLVVARCTPPNWPFPCDIPLDHTHFLQLRSVRGERAKRQLAEPLIRQAYALEGMETPDWAVTRNRTMRSIVKKSSEMKRPPKRKEPK